MRLADKVAVITGAGSGMGRATAILFAREGARVVVADVNAAAGAETARTIAAAGGRATFTKADVSLEAEVAALIAETARAHGRLDILFNNAGVPQAFTPIEEVSEAQWERIFSVNAKGVFLGCKHAVPVMKRQGGGAILNTASTAAPRPRPGSNAYAASKGAVVTLTKALAIELAPARIRVNCIAPVATDTPMLPGFIGNKPLEEGKQALIATIPLGRLARPEDIAQAALYLASDEASLVTGVCLEVDGGRCL
jgi:3-oxoacyl-[acyl-carrier protein] reductase